MTAQDVPSRGTPALDAALAYANAGIPVHPVAGKRPLTKWKDAASTDPAIIRGWWKRWPGAGVAVVTGARSGLFVVDLDIDKETGEAIGEAAAMELGLSECFAGAPVARTGSGGRHVFFRAEPGLENSVSKLAAGVDTRGEGGFVVAAGSPGYEWLGPTILELSPPPVPEKLRAALRGGEREKPAPAPEPGNVVPFGPLRALERELASSRSIGGPNAWAETALERELAALRAQAKGGRNHALNAAAFSLGQIVAGGGLEESRVRDELAAAARAIGLEEHETGLTINSGLRKGMSEPRTAPERLEAATFRVQDLRFVAPEELEAKRSARVGELLGSVVFADAIEVQPFSPYLIKRWLDRGTVSVLYGPSNVGKSFLALDMARAVALGEPWHGRKVQGGGALYFIAEGERRFANRVAALGIRPSRLVVVPRPLDLFGEIDVAAVVELVKALQARIGEVVFIVIDTYARNAGGAEENSAKDVSRVLNHVGDILRETGAHVMLVSHMGKDEARGLRGSSAIKGAVDHMIEVTEEGGVIFANAAEKQRHEAKTDLVFPYRLAVVELATDQDGEPLTSCRVEPVDTALSPKAKREKPSPSGYAVLEALRQFTADHGEELPGGTGFPDRSSRLRGVDLEPFCAFARGKVAGSRQQKSQAVKRGLEDLRAKGYAGQTDDKIWLIKRCLT